MFRNTRIGTMFALAGLSVLCAGAYGDTLAVYPPEVRIDHTRDSHRIVVVVTREDGVTMDVTSDAELTAAPEGVVTWSGNGIVRGTADGEGTLTVAYGGQTAAVPFRVQNSSVDPPMSFRNDVEPALMQAGCNTGACHGSASGKNGFHLTLFGYDPKEDYVNLTRQARGRRMNVAQPEDSLMLLKALGDVNHGGGQRFRDSSLLYETLERWIAEGAKDDPADLPQLTGIDIMPEAAVLEGEDARQQFIVVGHYSDGTDRDVTELSVLSSEDERVLALNNRGRAKAGARGEVYVMARFGTFAEVSQVITIPEGETVKAPAVPPANYIDELVQDKLKRLRISQASPSSDEVFLRRAYLDVLGVLPRVEESRAFLADDSPEKRAALIDQLLERPEFADLWAMKWAELLRVRTSQKLDRKAMHRYNDWLRHAITNNRPINEIAYDLITAEGGNFTEPASNFYIVEDDPKLMAENVAQVFMGIQIKCAQCHNHPFERWTMDDYYSFAAFFAQVGKKASSDPRENIVFDRGRGEVKNQRDGQVMQPKFLGGSQPEIGNEDRRAVLAEWLTSEDNPWFAKNVANRVWAHFLGRGIIEPVDDVRVSNPPSNPQLLEALADRLVEQQYDLRQLVRDICNSNTYQMATQAPPDAVQDTKNFAYARVRRLPSEFLLDAISQVTESKVKFASLPLGARAVQVADGPSGNYFLSVFGRPERITACTAERRNEPTLAQALHLINGNTIDQAINDGNGRLAERLVEETAPADALEELYLAAYARYPTDEERSRLVEFVETAEDREAAMKDVYWSVLNSKEFVFNH